MDSKVERRPSLSQGTMCNCVFPLYFSFGVFHTEVNSVQGQNTSITSDQLTMAMILFQIFSLFPHNCRKFLIGCWFMLSRHHNVDDHCMEAVCHLTLPKVLKRVFSLALDEMEQIKELDLRVSFYTSMQYGDCRPNVESRDVRIGPESMNTGYRQRTAVQQKFQ